MEYLPIKKIPIDDRPYEKLETYSENVLSNAELLAIIIKTGTKNETCVQIAQKLLALDTEKKGLNFLYDLSLEELKRIKGIGRVKSIQIKATLELAKRLNNRPINKNSTIKSPGDVYNLLIKEMLNLKQEILKIIMLDTKNKIIKTETVSLGTLNRNIVQAREVFAEPIKLRAASIILVHNHPSGDPMPSKEDINFTKRYMEIGKMLGISVIDHIVIGNNKYISLREEDLI